MAKTDEDEFRREVAALLAVAPTVEQLQTTYAGRLLHWLATPADPVDNVTDPSGRRRKKKRYRRTT